jgi:hypothetical protein
MQIAAYKHVQVVLAHGVLITRGKHITMYALNNPQTPPPTKCSMRMYTPLFGI